MLTMKGRYNSANIMIDDIDITTHEQIQSFLDDLAFADTYIAIMPDCHAGKGAVIGLTMKMNQYIIPNIVGVDIGCGMVSAHFDTVDFDTVALDKFIKKNIPAGFNIHKQQQVNDIDELHHWTKVIGMDYSKAIKSIGTLGGGNHFLEVGKDSQNRIWATVHSGSRNFGLQVANYFQNIARKNFKQHPGYDHHKDLEYLLVKSKDGQDYLNALRFAQKYASLNRSTMMRKITDFFSSDPVETIESIHNFIGDDNIIRKGATPAHKGEKVIIPFNMRDGLALCTGKGSRKYNYSAPHGAGRILSRTKARHTLSVSHFKEDMNKAGIYTTTATKGTIDEAPDAYKDMNIIIKNIAETVDIIDFVKPVYNFKANGD